MEKNMKKLLLLMSLMMLLLTSCKDQSSSLYYNDEEIVSDYNTFNLTVINQTLSNHQLTGTVEFEGMDTIWSLVSSTEMELDITYFFHIVQGKVKLVHITPDNTLTTITEVIGEEALEEPITSTLLIKEGYNRIKLVADKYTSFEFEVRMLEGELQKLGM